MHTLQTDILGPVRVFPLSSPAVGAGEGVAILSGTPESAADTDAAPLLRIHSRCLYGELLKSRDCDCLAQYEEAVRLILDARSGIICYLEQEGRGKGLIHKARAYEYMETHRVDTVDAYKDLDYELDPRSYDHVIQFLREIGISRIRLITNNPRKISALTDAGIRVERVPAIVGINHWNIDYIQTKRRKLGHIIDLVPPTDPATEDRDE